MLEYHVLDSRLDSINIYFEHWHQDHRFEEINMILRGYKRRIQVIALCQSHDVLMS
jgi:hypothetical protein